MLRHLAGNWFATIETLARMRWLLVMSVSEESARNAFMERRDQALPWIKEEIEALPFSVSLREQFRRLSDALQQHNSFTDHQNSATITRLDEFAHNIQSELSSHLFFVVPASRKGWYHNDDVAIFGNEVADAFPDSTAEIAEAGRCLALARWTASVFHFMRALELALHKWAIELGVTQFSAIELENWKNILDAAEKKIKSLGAC